MTKQEIIEILEENKDLIEKKDFETFYKNIKSNQRKYFTDLFLKSQINPLDYMESVPWYYADSLNNLEKIKIPNNVTSIGYEAFYGCSSLTTVTFGENSQLTRIGERAFHGCISLTEIEIPENVTDIISCAFENCSNLTSIVIPRKVTNIGYKVFTGCSSLTSITFQNLDTFDSLQSSIMNGLNLNIKLPGNPDWLNIYKNLGKTAFKETFKNTTFIIGKDAYTYDFVMTNFIEPNIKILPVLYRIDDNSSSLIAYNSSKGEPRVSYRQKVGLRGIDCPLFFEKIQDAEDFIEQYNKLGKNQVDISDIHKARLSTKDAQFSLIKTECGECLIQEWKSSNIDSKYIIKKEYF